MLAGREIGRLWPLLRLYLLFFAFLGQGDALSLEYTADVVPFFTGQTLVVSWVKDQSPEPPRFNLFLEIEHPRFGASVALRLEEGLVTEAENPRIEVVLPHGYPGTTNQDIDTYMGALEYYLVALSPDETETFDISDSFHVEPQGEQEQIYSSPPLNDDQSTSSSPAGNSGSSSGLSSGAIAGIVVSAVAAVLLILALAWYCRRKSQMTSPGLENVITPALLPSDANAGHTNKPIEEDVRSATTSQPFPPSISATSTSQMYQLPGTVSTGTVLSHSTSPPTTNQDDGRILRLEAEVRMLREDVDRGRGVQTPPPQYYRPPSQ